MLSNPTRDLQARQRATHRRQNSTPSAFEAAKIPALPNVQQQRQRALGHRRGLSLDTRRHLQAMSPMTMNTATNNTNTGTSATPATTTTSSTPTRQDFTTVSTNTNTGLATTSPQHVLREAQQQRIQACPGTQHQSNFTRQQQQPQQQHHPQPLHLHHQQNFMSASDHENYLISPHGTPHHQRYDPSCFDASPVAFNPFHGGGAQSLDGMVPLSKDPAAFAGSIMSEKDLDLFGPNSTLSTPTFINFQDSPGGHPGWHSESDVVCGSSSSRRTGRRISNGIMDRVAKFEGMETASRPMTPPHQNANGRFISERLGEAYVSSMIPGYFPPTPMETPHNRMSKQEPVPVSMPRPSRFAEGYDESMEETLKPVRRQGSNKRTQTIFDEMRQRAEEENAAAAQAAPPQVHPTQSQPHGVTQMGTQVPTADLMHNFNNSEFLRIQPSGRVEEGVNTVHVPADDVSRHATPHTPHGTFHLANPFENNPGMYGPPGKPPASPSRSGNTSSRRRSPHRRTESLASMASMASAASIADINIEETKTETGVTLDDISMYIQGPDASDNKWLCLYEGCGKKFGRKENIKSHVQTHLNDRQYQCPSCKKCFVRQHDLKRHAKIHTGIKPYPCECGNSFARHDALTRHRQRGMCIGAFDGIVKKVVKRGRPRKHRPDMDERVDKAARTRRKNKSSPGSASSQSGYSDASVANSPEATTGTTTITTAGIKQESASMMMTGEIAAISSAPMPSARVPTISPEPGVTQSPSTTSHHHPSPYVSPEAIMESNSAAMPQFNHPQSEPIHTAPTSPTRSTPSQYNTPPELSQSSSPPATRYFDPEPNSSSFTDDDLLADMRTTSTITPGAGSCASMPTTHALDANTSLTSLGIGEPDDEMLMKAFTTEDEGGLGSMSMAMSFDRDPNVLMMSKFDDFDDAVDMFTNHDDMFFGSS
ncbi:hypothetical protein ACRALDRAFT_1066139 [Sodiomyces alcalophilus JCM 7366]|uniref:uncharacterized protein n=1 Tax=Sodiomyces alcalophilus JCM 7366 TaxID=591952 RepID=UPI0039B53E73